MIPQHILDLLEMKHNKEDPIPCRVTVKAKPCADCGLFAEDRTVNITLTNRAGVCYWRYKCSFCKLSSLDGETWKTSTEIEQQMRGLK